ncbi:hypothetical protein PMI04_002040 [Sphingobium sp. AP49]|uniref:hypothetical protein n=1 Tax=Sphingobium sp. AP49 TaxID=1144307 RepID=UPI00026ED79B|nr:hypothetical protein [Sphingobium sp. AP49]WHO39404.1 hypothetical protein PMI04_002040 [Sphingobium sp. AP49]
MILLAFLILSAVCCFYALIRGGSPERLTATIFLAGIFASIMISIHAPPPPDGFQSAIFAVDLAMLLALGAIMLFARRYWPMAITACQLLAVMGHVIRLLNPQIVPVLYWISNVFWAVPQMLFLAVATIRHCNRVRRHGSDPAWSPPPAGDHGG